MFATARRFRLSTRMQENGVGCDANGVFIGPVALLKREKVQNRSVWRARDCGTLSDELSAHFGLPIDMASKAGGLAAIARALNSGDIARAQIATLFLRFPEPLAKHAPRDARIGFIRALHASGLIKAEWNPTKHPRWPRLAPNSQGGRFAPKGTPPNEPGIGHNGGPPLEEDGAEGEAGILEELAPIGVLATGFLLASTVSAGGGEDEITEQIYRHHSWPKYLGGAKNQPLTKLPKTLHDQYHRELDRIAPRRWGETHFRNLPANERVSLFKKILSLTRDFDARYGTHLYSDMLRNGFPEEP